MNELKLLYVDNYNKISENINIVLLNWITLDIV